MQARSTPLRRAWTTPLLPLFPDDQELLPLPAEQTPDEEISSAGAPSLPPSTASAKVVAEAPVPTSPAAGRARSTAIQESSLEAVETASPATISIPVPDRGSPAAKQALVEQLAREVRRLETSRRIGPADAAETGTLASLPAGPVFSSGCRVLDDCLPRGGYEAGTIIEYIQIGAASGAVYLALSAAKAALAATDRFCVVVDAERRFYPPAAAAMGIDLKRLVVVRPQSLSDRLWTLDQALRCSGVAAVIGEAEQLDDRSARRLQLAAERGGGIGLLLRGRSACRQPSWAEVQWLVRPCSQAADTSPTSTDNSRIGNSSINGSILSGSLLAGRQVLPQQGDRELDLELLRVRGGEAGIRVPIAIRASDGCLQAARPGSRVAAQAADADRAAASLASRLAQTKRPVNAQPQTRRA